MKFTLVIHQAPQSEQAALSAYNFAQAAVANGHHIYRLFFYGDGVHNTSTLTVTPQDETNLPQQWARFCETNQIDAVACVSSAIKRGIINEEERRRYELEANNLASFADISGLGQLIDAINESDRVINFG